MPFIIAAALLGLFTVNVVVGAVGDGPVVGNVAEMLILLAAAISFTIGILKREAAEKKTNLNN